MTRCDPFLLRKAITAGLFCFGSIAGVAGVFLWARSLARGFAARSRRRNAAQRAKRLRRFLTRVQRAAHPARRRAGAVPAARAFRRRHGPTQELRRAAERVLYMDLLKNQLLSEMPMACSAWIARFIAQSASSSLSVRSAARILMLNATLFMPGRIGAPT